MSDSTQEVHLQVLCELCLSSGQRKKHEAGSQEDPMCLPLSGPQAPRESNDRGRQADPCRAPQL